MPAAEKRTTQMAIFSVAVSFFWAALYFYVPTLTVHARSLGATDTMIGMIVGSYGLTQLLLRIPLGIVSDRLGVRKPFVILGFIISIVSAILMTIATTPAEMLLARALTGVAASTWVASTVLFSAFFPSSQAVRSTSIMSLASSLGQLVATFAGGYIAQSLGLKAPYIVAAVVAGVGALAIAGAADDRRDRREVPSIRAILRVLVMPSLLLISLTAAIVQYASFATSYAFVPVYANEVLGLAAAKLGILTAVVLIPYVLMTAVIAKITNRISERILISAGLIIMALSTTAIPLVHNYEGLILARAVFGLGMGSAYPVLMGLSIKSVPQARRASAMGAFQAIYALGMTIGPALSGVIADRFSLNAVFNVTGLICLLGLLPLWLRVKTTVEK